MTPGRPPPLALRDPSATKELALQSLVGDAVRQRPWQPRRRPLQIALDRHGKTPTDLARAHPIVVKPQ